MESSSFVGVGLLTLRLRRLLRRSGRPIALETEESVSQHGRFPSVFEGAVVRTRGPAGKETGRSRGLLYCILIQSSGQRAHSIWVEGSNNM